MFPVSDGYRQRAKCVPNVIVADLDTSVRFGLSAGSGASAFSQSTSNISLAFTQLVGAGKLPP
jgi:hypothetical protein